jgi:hypothetical protein
LRRAAALTNMERMAPGLCARVIPLLRASALATRAAAEPVPAAPLATRAAAGPVPAAPLAWDGGRVADGDWRIDPTDGSLQRSDGTRVPTSQMALRATPLPADAIASADGKWRAWRNGHFVCVARASDPRGDTRCLGIPAAHPAPPARDPRVTALFAAPRDFYWLTARAGRPGCERWQLHPAVADAPARLVHQAGDETIEYTLALEPAALALLGPSRLRGGDVVSALGAIASYPLGDLHADALVVGAARWFLAPAACRRAATLPTAARQIFTPIY